MPLFFLKIYCIHVKYIRIHTITLYADKLNVLMFYPPRLP